MGGFISRPKPAPRPEPRPEPVQKPIVETKAEKKKYDDTKRKGRRSTILTTPDYEDTAATTNQPTLLGG